MRATGRRSGFTIIELMIVVSLIGLLSAVAIPSFLRYQANSRRSEALTNLPALAKAEKAYYAEWSSFVEGNAVPIAVWPPSKAKRDMTEVATEYALVGWAPEGDVYYSYTADTCPAVAGCGTCFTLGAWGDTDNDGLISGTLFAAPDPAGALSCPDALFGTSVPAGQYNVPEPAPGMDDF